MAPMRARDYKLPLRGRPGPLNAITDVPGLEVGYTTLIEGDGPRAVRTGVTAILPRGRAGVGDSCAAGTFSLNGNGELTGRSWIDEAGSLGGPVLLTNTHAVGACHRAIVDWIAEHHPSAVEQWLLPVVGETFDGYLNDINGHHVGIEHGRAALDDAKPGPVAEGSVGGGTGMNCYAFKGGSGTASRVVWPPAERGHGGPTALGPFTVGVFVQANFGRRKELVIAGSYLGERLAADNPLEAHSATPPGAGSVIAIVATDAPLLPGQCAALARRVPLGLARTGTTGSHFSGDLFLAFSTANRGQLASRSPDPADRLERLDFLPWGQIDEVFAAVVEATEEAVLNALVAGRDMVGRDGHRTPGIPLDVVAGLATT